MKIDTTNCQIEMYMSMNWLPVKFFKDNMCDQKWNFPKDVWINGEHWALKNDSSINAHYEREEK